MVGLVPIIVLSLALSVLQTTPNPTAAYYSPLTRAWELALGALIACRTPWLSGPADRRGRLAGSRAAIACRGVRLSASPPYPGILVAVPVSGPDW